ncbi:hypothetical protein LOK49_LG08G03146 [Camellia lanceoleosa]|uniref:Uncharacterized protein n=1 Tax=Camellia lanceoleosa TaxID=1840588 RepID=A0ACC0GV01_9ERIC|nr:hypothetical protein LOK49_LG08G03146 [Camellia lanceoleosa]
MIHRLLIAVEHPQKPRVVTPFPAPKIMDLPQFQGDHKESSYWGTYRPKVYLGIRARTSHIHNLSDLVQQNLGAQVRKFGCLQLSDTTDDSSNILVFQILGRISFRTDVAFISGTGVKDSRLKERLSSLTAYQKHKKTGCLLVLLNKKDCRIRFENIHFRAGRGSHGPGKKQNGAKGEDVVVKVAPGMVIREAAMDGEQGEVLLELLYPGQRVLLLPGGSGGRGNASFKSGTNKVPKIAEIGEEGPELWLELELKLVADVGIIDLPGLLEGAHRGFGLGHEFLRHTERCSALVHVVDGSSQQPEYEFDAVRLELELFNPELAEKPYLVAYNKMDLLEASERWVSFKENLQARGIEPFCMSAVMREATHEVICAAYELVRKRMEDNKEEGWNNPVNLNHVADMVQKQRTAPINEFEISHESSTNTWHVVGSGLQRFVQMTNWRYIDSERRFQHVLEACGVYKSLIKGG